MTMPEKQPKKTLQDLLESIDFMLQTHAQAKTLETGAVNGSGS